MARPKKERTTLTIRVKKSQKEAWKKKAEGAGMSLTLFVSYVMDRTEISVSTKGTEAPAPA